MTRIALAIVGGLLGLWLLRRQLFGDPAPDTGWREWEAVDSV